MSGAEAITAIQLIDACIGITEAIIDIGQAAKDAQGLPQKLQKLFETLPAIEDLLESAQNRWNEGNITDALENSAQPILKQIQEALDKLRKIFRDACPKDKDNRAKRIWDGTKTVFFGRDSKVRELLTTIQENLKLLEQKEIYVIGDKLDALQEISEALLEESDSKYTHSGSGHIFANEGNNQKNNVVGGSNNRQINDAGNYYEGATSTTYNVYSTNASFLGTTEIQAAENARKRKEDRDKFMQSLYRHACIYKEAKNRNRTGVSGTCQWIINHNLFQKWASSKSCQTNLLYVTADPGCGKSVLSRYLIDEVLPREGRIVCYFFFKDDFEDQRSCLRAICTLLHQLLDTSSLLTDDILKKFGNQGERFFESFDNLWRVFIDAAAQQDTVCVFDGLDECASADMRQLASAVLSLSAGAPHRSGPSSIKCLLTSRPYDHIRRQMHHLDSKVPLIHIQGDQGEVAEEIVEEIRLVMYSRIKAVSEALQLSPAVEEWFTAKLESISNRTYLWITLIFDGLMQSESWVDEETIQDIIENPPSTVDEAYEKILSRFPKTAEMRRWILQAILVARRPLTTTEIAVVMEFQLSKNPRNKKSSGGCSSARKRFCEKLRELCGMFVVVVDDNVYLLHQTAREFLLCTGSSEPYSQFRDGAVRAWKGSMSLAESHSVLAKVCIWYLLSRFQGGNTGFQIYAANCWAGHYRQSSTIVRVELAEATRDLCSSTEALAQWLHLFERRNYGPSGKFPLCTAAWLGLEEAVRLMLADCNFGLKKNIFEALPTNTTLPLSHFVNVADSFNKTALSWASMEGHEGVIRLLLDTNEVNVNTENSWSESPLLSAARIGHEAIVKLLLETNEVNVNSKGLRGETPLSVAVASGHKGIEKLLLDTNKVEIDAGNKYADIPLCMPKSFKGGYLKYLLEMPHVPQEQPQRQAEERTQEKYFRVEVLHKIREQLNRQQSQQSLVDIESVRVNAL